MIFELQKSVKSLKKQLVFRHLQVLLFTEAKQRKTNEEKEKVSPSSTSSLDARAPGSRPTADFPLASVVKSGLAREANEFG